MKSLAPAVTCALVAAVTAASAAASAVDISVDASAGRKPVSPALYGKNNNLSDNAGQPTSESTRTKYRDAGLRLTREGGGNNQTKYNWRLKLSSHPDWYNNVYSHSWDYSASEVQQIDGLSGLYSFQLLGKAAKTNQYNFNDWEYNGSQWTPEVANNWAGGGGPSTGEGDPDLYLMDWPPESTATILDHWFKPTAQGGLGYDSTRLRYWNMDNEPEIWDGTHDDAVTDTMPVEHYLQKYFAVAKLARARFPGIKLVGPVFTNEWQWWAWNGRKITVNEGGTQKSYVWAQYFIKRIGEEQQASGVRLLDVLDFHFYPGLSDPAQVVQAHRVWFDTTYVFPGANGVKLLGQYGWDDSIRKEYVWARCRAWLDLYCGPGHGVTFGVTECGAISDVSPSVYAVWYASHLGTFADEGVEVFCPWDWYEGMWETLHLFSRYGKTVRVQSTSSQDTLLSAYSSLSAGGDSLSVILVNRASSGTQTAAVTPAGFTAEGSSADVYQLSNLAAGQETFVSRTQNALAHSTTALSGAGFSLSLPAYSVTAVVMKGQADTPVIGRKRTGRTRVTCETTTSFGIDGRTRKDGQGKRGIVVSRSVKNGRVFVQKMFRLF